ncbi:MAG: hypothetical protein Q9227_008315 [Pyrenula ochraceoflavens]
MAEVLGVIASSVTIATLFKACLEAFDLIQTGRRHELDLKKLKLRLDTEKLRLYTWGEAMGISDEKSSKDRSRPIDQYRFPQHLQDVLEVLFGLFNDAYKIRDKNGCREAASNELRLENDDHRPAHSIAASFSNFAGRPIRLAQPPRIPRKIVWVIQDCKKFGAFVVEIKDLVDSLQNLTSRFISLSSQVGQMREKIGNIRDNETLSLIAEVCAEVHPSTADAAATKADSISETSTRGRNDATSVRDTRNQNEEARTSSDLESLTVTELKQKILEMHREREARERSSLAILEHYSLEPRASSSTVPKQVSYTSTEGSKAIPPLARPPGLEPSSAKSQPMASKRISALAENPVYRKLSTVPCTLLPHACAAARSQSCPTAAGFHLHQFGNICLAPSARLSFTAKVPEHKQCSYDNHMNAIRATRLFRQISNHALRPQTETISRLNVECLWRALKLAEDIQCSQAVPNQQTHRRPAPQTTCSYESSSHNNKLGAFTADSQTGPRLGASTSAS